MCRLQVFIFRNKILFNLISDVPSSKLKASNASTSLGIEPDNKLLSVVF